MSAHSAIDAVRAARERAERHTMGDRDTSLSTRFDNQVSRFLDELRRMEAALEGRDHDPINLGMSRAVADSWPYDSELGELIARAEVQYTNATS